MAMVHENEIELAKEKMLQAENALEDYFRSAKYDPEKAMQLSDRASAARLEYISQLRGVFLNK